MLKVTYRLKLGQDEFELNLDVKDEKDFFEQLSFYSNLPKTAPGGSTDLKLVFRTTKKGHKYYSLVSEKEKMEFKFGQNLEANGGGLFPKSWEPAYQNETEDHAQGPAPIIGAQAVAPTPVAAPQVQQTVAAPIIAAPTPIQMPTPVAAPAAIAPTPAAVPQAPAPTVNPNVSAVASSVLARFNIAPKT